MSSSLRFPNHDIQVLRELGIPGRTKEPVSTNPNVWGLNIAAVLDNFPRHGLQCLAGPWGSMGRGDRLVIFWGNNNQVLQKIVDQTEVDTELRLFIEAARIRPGHFDVSYTVTRLGQVAEPSEVMKVLVKLTRPGGKDDNDTPGHSKLIMRIPPEIIAGGIDKDNVADGVDITIEPYPEVAVGDVIRLSWGGVLVYSLPLTQDQVDGKTPIVIHVDEATIREAGDSDDTGLAVVFECYDQVDNRSEDWSAAQRVVVGIDQQRPPAPLLREAQNNVLDVDKLGTAPGTAQVLAIDNRFFAKDDLVFIRLKGTPLEGLPLDEELPGKPVDGVPSILEVPVPNALLRRLAKTQLVLSYRIQKADGSLGFLSKGQFITVIGEVQRLKPPIAEDARQGALDPDLPRTRIEIPFDASFAAGQVVKLFWLGTLPDFTPYLPDLPPRPITQGDIDAKVSLFITVEAAHIKPVEGGTLELYYQVLVEDSVLETLDRYTELHAVRESEHAALLNVGEPRQELPVPTVAGVVDGALDPDRLDTTLTATWLNTLKDDKVTCEWEGSKTGVYHDSVILNSFTAGQPIPFTIQGALIKGNEGGTVTASYSVERAGDRTRYSQALAFSVGAALTLTPPTILQAEADGKTLQPLKAKDALTAVIAPDGLLLTDQLSVTWTGAAGTAAGGSHTTPAKPISEVGLSIALPVTVLAFNLGKTVSVTCTVTRDGKATTSLPLSLNVQQLAQSALPKPIIRDADNNGEGPELNVGELTANATYRMGLWPLIAIGQYVWLRLTGTKEDGSAYNKTIHTAPGSSVSQSWIDAGYYERAIALSELRSLKDGSSLTMEFKAAFGKSTTESEAVVFPIRTYTVKTLVDVRPTLSRIEDSKEVEILPGGTTVDTSLTLHGTATPNQEIVIYRNNATTGGKAIASDSGLWTREVIRNPLGTLDFTAVALYGSGQVSPARTLTVIAEVKPEITSVKGANSVDIPNGGTTLYTDLSLTGKASLGQKVQILDGATLKGDATAGADGLWTFPMTGLSAAAHSFTAKALYGAGQTSLARTLTVIAELKPEITSVKGSPSDVEIPNGGATSDTSVTLLGTANALLEVQVLDGTTPKATVEAGSDGTWTTTVTELVINTHVFTAKALYGSNLVSPAWTVIVQYPELNVDTSPLRLYGYNYFPAASLGWTRIGVAPDTTGVRVVSGGQPPYSVNNSAPHIVSASISGTTINIAALNNGVATITVIDQGNRQKSFDVIVTNNYEIIENRALMTAYEQREWGRSVGATYDFVPLYMGASWAASRGKIYWAGNMDPSYPTVGRGYQYYYNNIPQWVIVGQGQDPNLRHSAAAVILKR